MTTASQMKLAIAGIANDFRNELVATCPVDTGYLKDNIKAVPGNSEILVTMPYYGMYIEFGTAPHIIKAKDSPYLHFKIGDNWVKTKEVKHPGTQSNPFIRTAIRTKLKGIVAENVKRHLQ